LCYKIIPRTLCQPLDSWTFQSKCTSLVNNRRLRAWSFGSLELLGAEHVYSVLWMGSDCMYFTGWRWCCTKPLEVSYSDGELWHLLSRAIL
jgi:hypothetical protein